MEQELYYTREGFTDEEVGALLSALDYYIYHDGNNLTEEQYAIAESARIKVLNLGGLD